MDPNQQNQNQSATEFSDAPAEPAMPAQNALLDSPETANDGDLTPAENPAPANGGDSTPALAENFASVIDG